MSSKPKKRSEAIDRPFAPAILARAKKIAAEYQIVIWHEDGEYYGRGLELPGTMDDGKTPDECVGKVREALVATVAYLLEKGRKPPIPAKDQGRTEQVNIRLSRVEKQAIEEAAHSAGYRGIADYLRVRGLSAG
ncbi:MAG: type II toxin-antitoxin system HicB family antitoxin [Tepidisphaerales bacterium]